MDIPSQRRCGVWLGSTGFLELPELIELIALHMDKPLFLRLPSEVRCQWIIQYIGSGSAALSAVDGGRCCSRRHFQFRREKVSGMFNVGHALKGSGQLGGSSDRYRGHRHSDVTLNNSGSQEGVAAVSDSLKVRVVPSSPLSRPRSDCGCCSVPSLLHREGRFMAAVFSLQNNSFQMAISCSSS